METKKIGDEILVEQAWEDEQGNYHDEYAKILEISKNGIMKLDFKNKKINNFLKDAEFFVQDYV